MKKEIVTSKAPAAVGAYSQAVRNGNMVFASGQIPLNPATGEMAETAAEQAKQSMENIKAILEEAGLTFANVVKTTVLLTDMNDFAAVNEVYASYFEKPYPARSCFAVRGIPKGCKLEIEVIAMAE